MKLALLFPGQGSQFVGMGKALSRWSAQARDVFDEADDVLRYPLSRLCFEGPEEKLRLTENTQPAILAASIAAARALESHVSLAPSWVAGHSLGEYSALVTAGSFSLADALVAVRERGKAMQKAVGEGVGSMAALLGMGREEVEAICAEVTDDKGLVAPANFNSPGQIVIAGHREKVQAAMARFRERGGKRAVELPVSAPFHCRLMEPAAARLVRVLDDIAIDSPNPVLINNAGARPLDLAVQVAPSLIRQITSPVMWEDSIRFIIAEGADMLLELGPGKVLCGIVKRIDRGLRIQPFGTPEDLDAVVALVEEVS